MLSQGLLHQGPDPNQSVRESVMSLIMVQHSRQKLFLHLSCPSGQKTADLKNNVPFFYTNYKHVPLHAAIVNTLNGFHHAGGPIGSILILPHISQILRVSHWVRMLSSSVRLEYKLCPSGCAGRSRLRMASHSSVKGLFVEKKIIHSGLQVQNLCQTLLTACGFRGFSLDGMPAPVGL